MDANSARAWNKLCSCDVKRNISWAWSMKERQQWQQHFTCAVSNHSLSRRSSCGTKRMLSWESGGTERERGKGAEAGSDITVQILMKTPHQITIFPSSTLPPTPYLSQFFPSLPPATRMHGQCNGDLQCVSHVVKTSNVRTVQ